MTLIIGAVAVCICIFLLLLAAKKRGKQEEQNASLKTTNDAQKEQLDIAARARASHLVLLARMRDPENN